MRVKRVKQVGDVFYYENGDTYWLRERGYCRCVIGNGKCCSSRPCTKISCRLRFVFNKNKRPDKYLRLMLERAGQR